MIKSQIGNYTKGKYKSYSEGSLTKEYRLWKSMLNRCYGKSTPTRKPTYKGCTVSDNFKDFQFFAEWCNNQVGFGNEGWQLDKDILIKGNKVYSEDNCCFVPKEINCLFLDHQAKRGNCPIGVSYHKPQNNYQVSLSKYGKVHNLGYFLDPINAHKHYIVAKILHVKEIALSYKEAIDQRVYEALMAWEG